MSYQNIQERCVELTCRRLFTITSGEQSFFRSKGYKLPKRCPDCRAKRKGGKTTVTLE